MAMQSLNDFLQQAVFNYVVYDMGRRMIRLTPQQFTQFENTTIAYPTPYSSMPGWESLAGKKMNNRNILSGSLNCRWMNLERLIPWHVMSCCII